MGASGFGSKVWVLTIGVLEVNPELDSVWDGLWRPGGAFFQIGLGCVMSHHQSPHIRALQIPVLILAGKFKLEFLPTVSHSKTFPVRECFCKTNIRQELHFEFSRQNVQAEMCISLLCGDDSSQSQGQSGKRLLLAFRGRKTIPRTIPKFLC